MTMNTFLTSILLMVSVFAVAEIGIFVDNARNTAKETTKIVQESGKLISDIHKYTDEQIKNLEQQQKSINASLQAAAVFNGTGRLINTQTIPRINRALDSINESVTSMNLMVQNTDASINKILLPQMAETAKSFNVSVDSLNDSIIEISKQTSLTIQQVRATMASDEWKEVLANMASISGHVDGISKNVEDTTARMPAMAALVEKMMKTTSRYQKALILSQIFSAISRAF